MKQIILLLFLSFSALSAETANDLAKRIISQDFAAAYNPIDSSKEERIRAAAINSQLRLNWLMQSDEVTEELRICYAIKVLNKRIEMLSRLGSGIDPAGKPSTLQKEKDILASRLIELNEQK